MARPTYVIATDLSADSRKAAEVAARIAERTRASLDFFCAIPARTLDEYAVDLAHARAGVEAVARRHAEAVPKAQTHVAVVRDVAAAILRHAAKARAAMLVVAPHGATGWKRALLGSVTEKVLRSATMPVLVARAGQGGPTGSIVAAVDQGTMAATTMRNAIALARLLRARLFAVHVVKTAELLLPLVAPADRALRVGDHRLAERARDFRALVASFPARGVTVKAVVREGSPAEEVVAEAKERGAGLIVVGASDKSGVRRALLGSVAHAIASASPTSVLVLRETSAS